MKHCAIFLLFVSAALLLSAPLSAGKRQSYVIQAGDTPGRLVKKYKIPYDEILRFNNMKPGDVLKAGRKLDIPFPGEVTGSEYIVKKGDSIARIADFHGVSQADLRAANGLEKNEAVVSGQVLKIPYELRAGAAKGHVVRKGDTLFFVAKKHGVSVSELAATNKLKKNQPLELGRTLLIPEDDREASEPYRPKKVSALLVTGKKVRGGVLHTVQEGQSLWVIARAYNTSGDKIAAANNLDKASPLGAGSELLIPGAKKPVPVRVKGFRFQPIHFLSVWNNKSAVLRLISGNGKINQRSRKILSRLCGPKRKTKYEKLLHPRLIHMIQRTAERFPGKTVELISGFRPRKPGHRESMHNLGRALDFRLRGVDRKELYEFVKQLPKVGAGYYPNSVFVHMDVREKSTFWVDFSGIGEPARYGKAVADIDPSAAIEAAADAQ
jgi:LysM repeat protein